MSIFLKAGKFQGAVTAKNYQSWIELHHIEFAGITQSMHIQPGNSQSRIIGTPVFGKMHITKPADPSSVKWFESAYNGQLIPEIEIHSLTSGDTPFTYAKYLLKNVLVSHFSDWQDEGGRPQENITLSFEKIQKTYIPRNSQNKVGSPMVAGYDISQAAKL